MESPHVGEEFFDVFGKSYDVVGTPGAFQKGSLPNVLSSIGDHLNKVVDYVVIDVTGATKGQVKTVQTYVNGLSKERQARIIQIGFF